MATSTMSKTVKRNILLSVVAIVIALVALFLPNRSGSDSVIWAPVKGDPDRLVFTREEGSFSVVLEEGDWLLEGKEYPVDSDKIDGVLDFISKEQRAEVVSKANVYTPYGLDQAERVEITFFQGEQLLRKIRVGKSANRFGSFYGMEDDNPFVYQIDFDRYNLEYKEKDIIDLEIFNFSPAEVAQVTLVDRDKEWDLYRVDKNDSTNNQTPPEKEWQDKSEKVYTKEKVNDIINTMSILQGEDISDTLPPHLTDATSILRNIKLVLNTGGSYQLEILDKGESGYWVRVSGQKFYYQITDLNGDKLLIDPTPQ